MSHRKNPIPTPVRPTKETVMNTGRMSRLTSFIVEATVSCVPINTTASGSTSTRLDAACLTTPEFRW